MLCDFAGEQRPAGLAQRVAGRSHVRLNVMQFTLQSRTGLVSAVVLTAVLCQGARGQDAQSKDAQTREAKGLPSRAAPADYQTHAQAGALTIAAEFTGHSITSPQSVLATEDYVVVEVGFFGPPEARLVLSYEDFSLRINGKKTPLPARPYASVFKSLKDPEWEPPIPVESKSKTSLGTGGAGQNDPGSTPPVVHVPIEVERGWELRVQKATLPEGERVIPVAGLIFFQYHGKTDNIDSIDLIYTGPAGKVTLKLHP
jgi:hypothetical protein